MASITLRQGRLYLKIISPRNTKPNILLYVQSARRGTTEFVKNDEDAMKRVYDFLKNSDALEIVLQLGERKTSLRFVETHRQDIRTILQNEHHR